MSDTETQEKTTPKPPSFKIEHEALDFGHKPFTAMMDVENKDERYEYRHVKSQPARIRRQQKLGFELVTPENDSVKTDSGTAPGGRFLTNNELVLMRRPKEIGEKHRAYLRKRAAMARRGPVESFKSTGQRYGVEVHDESHMTRGSLGMALAQDETDSD